jgi:hypothetical protein
VRVNLNSQAGGGDGQPDTVIVNGTNNDDHFQLTGGIGAIFVDRALNGVGILGSDGVTDHLTVNTLGGNDTVDHSALEADLIGLTVNLGDGQGGGDANTRFVDRLYQDLLGRAADAAGLAFWKGKLDQGLMTRSQVAAAIEGSTDYMTIVTQKAYQQFLHRGADQGGVNSWVDFLRQGHTIEQMEAGLIGSAEYFQVRGGGTNDGFLSSLFQDALGRAIDAGARAAFGAALASDATTGQVAAAVLSSLEGVQDTVQGFYRSLLGRPADNGGLNNFVSALQHGATDQQVIATIAGSDEFFANV